MSRSVAEPPTDPSRPRARGFLVKLGGWSFRHPWQALGAAVFGMILSLVLAVSNLSLETDWLILFSPKHPEIQTLEYWRDNLPGSKDLAVIVSRGDLKTRQRAVDQLGLSFAKHPEVLSSPLYSIDAKIFLHSGLYFLSKQQLLGLKNDLQSLLSGIRRGTGDDSFKVDSFADSLILAAPGAGLILRFMEALEESTRADLSDADLNNFWPAVEPESSKIREMMGSVQAAPPKRIYLSLDAGQTLLILVSPNIGTQNLEAAAPSVHKVREILEGVREQYPTLSFSLTGEPVLVVDERLTIAQDSVRSTVCSLFLVLALFHFGFREVARPALALATLIVGLVWTLGAVSLAVGHLNFITVTYIPILVGIGIDFGIHIGFRYFECRAELPGPEAMEQTMRTAGKDTLIGAMATSVAFGVLIVVGFRGVAELGLIAFLGVLLCQLSACTVLPALLGVLERRNFQLPQRGRQDLNALHQSIKPWNGVLLTMAGILTVLSIAGARYVTFDIHLLKMQNPNLESVRTEMMLVSSGKSSVLTALVPAKDLAQAREFENRLRALPSVAEVISLSTFLPQVEPGEESLVKEILKDRPELVRILKGIGLAPPLDARQALKLFSAVDEIKPTQTWGTEIKKLGQELRARASKRGPGPLLDGANEILRQLEQRANEMVPLLEIQTAEPLLQSQLPPALVQRLQGVDGSYALRVFPRLDIWRPENLQNFLEDLRKVNPKVSGEPVLIELFERLVMRTHRLGIVFSLLAMFGLLYFVLRDIRLTLLASLPTAISLLQVLGFMGMFSWSFNPANFVAVPMLLGIGSVFGLHSVLRMQELGNDRLLCCSTGLAILLSSLTSAAGFASLGLAEHRGIASLGGLVTLGLLVNVVLSLFILPCLVERFPHLLQAAPKQTSH